MSKLKKRLVGAASALLVIVLIGGIILTNQMKAKNVFDEMYRSSFDYYFYSPASLNNTKFLYPNGKGINWLADGFANWVYDPQYLEENQYIEIIANTEKKKLSFGKTIRYGDYAIAIGFAYYLDNMTLELRPVQVREGKYLISVKDPVQQAAFFTENGITQELLSEWMDELLYDRILKDYFDGNGGRSNFSLENLGKFKIVNSMFDEWPLPTEE